MEHRATIWRIPLDDDAKRLLAYTSLLDHKQGKNIIMFSSMSDVLVVSPQADSPVEEGRVGKSIHLLWLQV